MSRLFQTLTLVAFSCSFAYAQNRAIQGCRDGLRRWYSTVPNAKVTAAQVSLRRSEDAIASLRRAVLEDPADAEAVYFLGALLVQQGASQEGVALLERSREIRPAFWGTWYYLGKAALASGQPGRAVELLRRASELQPDEVAILYQLARAHKGTGNDTESRRLMQKYAALRAKMQTEEQEALVVVR